MTIRGDKKISADVKTTETVHRSFNIEAGRDKDKVTTSAYFRKR